MGCRASRLGQDEDGQPGRASLFRRFEDITWPRRSESIGKISTGSAKKLNEEEEGGGDEKHVVSVGLVKAHSLDGVNLKMVESGDEEEESGMVDEEREDHLFGPRSPSFREYCINYFSEELDKDDDIGNVEGAKGENSERKEGTPPPNPTEGSTTKVAKRGLKRRRFRKVLSIDGSMKYLWNVGTCSNTSSFSYSDNKTRSRKSRMEKPSND